MASSTISRPMDIVVKSMECYNMLIIDRNCHLHVPLALVDDSLTVDIGGNVVMKATTVDFTNSTINFAGATINNFTGNISGNISFTGNLNVETVTAQDIYGGTYHGDVISSSIIGPLTGPVCGDITTSIINEKVFGQGINVNGQLNGALNGDFTGNAFGSLYGDFYGTSNGIFNGIGYGDFIGNFCGNILAESLMPKNLGQNIPVFGNLEVEPGNFLIAHDACIDNILVGNIKPKVPGTPIEIEGNLITHNIITENVNVTGLLTTVTFATSSVIAPTGQFSSLKVDTISQNSISGITFIDKTYFNSPMQATTITATQVTANVLCGDDLTVQTISSKTLNPIIVSSDIDMSGSLLIADTICSNILQVDIIQSKHTPVIMIDGNVVVLPNHLITTDEIDTFLVKTTLISEAVNGGGVEITNNTKIDGNLLVTNTIVGVSVGAQNITAINKLNVLSASNQISLGSGFTTTLSATAPAASRTYTIPDTFANSSFVMTDGTQTINGTKNFSTPISTTSGGTALNTIGTPNQVLGVDTTGTSLEYKTIAAGSGIAVVTSPNTITITALTMTTFSGGTTGLLPNIPTTGPVVLSGTLATTNGGTGLVSPSIGSILIGNGASPMSVLLDASAGMPLISQGGSGPVYSQLSLTIGVTGVLPVANGGTNSATALNNNCIMISSGGAIIEANAGVSLTNGQILIGSTGVAPVAASITGTANQINVANGAGSITLSTPQNIHISATPTFASQTLSATSNQLTLGTISTVVLTAPTPASNRTYTIPDTGSVTSQFVMTDGSQSISGIKTFLSPIATGSGGTGLSAPAVGGLLIGNGASAMTVLSDAPLGMALISQGGPGPVYGLLSLTLGVTGVLPISNGGTNSSTALNNKCIMISSTGKIIEANAGVPLTDGQLLIGSTGFAPVASSITGTANQINVANGAGSITLSTPQDIDTLATPTFASQTLSATSNQLTLGTISTVVLTAPTPASNRTYTIPDTGSVTSQFVMTDGSQSISGIKTFLSPIATGSGGTGLSAPAIGGLLIGNGASAMTVLSDAPLGMALISQGGTGPVYGLLSLTLGVTGVLPVANGGTNSSTALNNKCIMISSAGAIIEANAGVPLTDGQLLIGSTGLAPVAASITGTSNQISVTPGAGSITLSTPQDIHTSATPTFASQTLSTTSNQLTLGTVTTIIVSAPTPAAGRTYTIPDTSSATATFLMTEGAQTINGVNTFSNTANLNADTNIGTTLVDTFTLNAKVASSGINGFTATSFAPFVFDADIEVVLAGVGGPISVLCYFTDISVGATNDAFTLADGTMKGQIKIIEMTSTGGGNAIITPTNLSGGTTITLGASGNEVTLMWNGTNWRLIKSTSHTISLPFPVLA